MKRPLIVLVLLFASVYAADPEAAQTQAPAAGDAYQQFIDQLADRENLADCISKMDGLIDKVELHAASSQSAPGGISSDTQVGLHLAFYIMSNQQAIVYYLVISRNGQELSFSDATKLAALFGDRAGLPHPVIITEGEKPVFYAQWPIKHSDWKAMQAMMLKVRAENRSENDPHQAFVTDIIR